MNPAGHVATSRWSWFVRAARRARIATAILLVVAGMALVCGCGKGETLSKPTNEAAAPSPVVAEKDGAQLSAALSRSEMNVGERVELGVSVVAPRGASIELPSYQSLLDGTDDRFAFRITPRAEAPPVVESDGRERRSRAYTLEAVLPGEYQLPGPTARVAAPSVSAGGGESRTDSEWATEKLALVVREPGGAGPQQAELADIPKLQPVDLPNPKRYWYWAGAAAALVLFALAIAMLKRRRRRQVEAAIHVPAHVWARREIDSLLSREDMAHGRFREFYYSISGIVRGYIERRFHLAAPEMTTEEFLAASSRDRRFSEEDRGQLIEFMNACDIVKYACGEPTTQDARGAIETAEAYIERTREQPGAIDETPDARERAA